MENSGIQTHKIRRVFGLAFLSAAIIFALAFLGMVAFYLWQFKYGDPKEILMREAQFRSKKFTFGNSVGEGPKAPADWSLYIGKNNPVLGNEKSGVTIIAFIDFECPFSQEGYNLFKSVTETYGGAVKVIFKHLPLTGIHPRALAAAEAASCAREQDKFSAYYDYLFATKKLSEADLSTAANAVNLNMEKFEACRSSARYRGEIESDVDQAIELGVRGTPTYFVNDEVIEGVVDRATWDAVILRNLKKPSSK